MSKDSVKEFFESPWSRAVSFLLMGILTVTSTMLLRAESGIIEDINENKQEIKELENRVDGIENIQIQSVVTLEYIRTTLEEIKADIREMK